jgi:predicted nucleotidyltransferase component of viral defense system
MMIDDPRTPAYHDDHQRFRESLSFTEAETGFSARLIEKDYLCTMVLGDFAAHFDRALVFKGGTCLSKVHADFFRLSEDLDFAVATPPDAARPDRRRAAAVIKQHFSAIPARLTWLEVADPFEGYNESRQYNGRVAYRSAVTGDREFIKIEVSMREEIILRAEPLPARTLLRDPRSGKQAIAPVNVNALHLLETYAEKTRAALTRPEPAIRDFFDIDHAVQQARIDHQNPAFLHLVTKKLAVAANHPVDLSAAKLSTLRTQLKTQLQPVLRPGDYDAFDLDRAFAALQAIWQLRPST